MESAVDRGGEAAAGFGWHSATRTRQNAPQIEGGIFMTQARQVQSNVTQLQLSADSQARIPGIDRAFAQFEPFWHRNGRLWGKPLRFSGQERWLAQSGSTSRRALNSVARTGYWCVSAELHRGV